MIAQTPTALTLPLRTPRATNRTPLYPADIAPRFTVDGSRELEQHLALTCAKIGAGIRGIVSARRLEGLLLGGGYGRGEGGVLRTMERGDRPYNDLEFYVFLRGNRHLNELRFGHALHVLGEILTPQAGIEVEFKIASLQEFAASPVSMFSYDMALGHRWIVGNDDLLTGCDHHFDADRIPLSEATRLLMNRCSGLLFARERLEKKEFTANDADFVRRNIAKAELALGDALLVAHRLYHWSVRERHNRLEGFSSPLLPSWWPSMRRLHVRGVAFKLHPQRSTESRADLGVQHAIVTALAREVWLWLEERRLNTKFASTRAYAQSRSVKWPESAGARNALVNARALGARSLLSGRAMSHPRERILHAMTLLLWEPDMFGSPELLARMQGELQTETKTFPEAMRAYRELWARVN
jgi:hypothetical protein